MPELPVMMEIQAPIPVLRLLPTRQAIPAGIIFSPRLERG
jgi:hypothetical protein